MLYNGCYFLVLYCECALTKILGIHDDKLEFESSEDIEVNPTFDSMGLREDLLRGIYAFSMLLRIALMLLPSYLISSLLVILSVNIVTLTSLLIVMSALIFFSIVLLLVYYVVTLFVVYCVHLFMVVKAFEKPSAIQQRAIVPIIKGRDVIAQAQSGTGKTATFSIGVLQSIDTSSRETQALILSPTRELAVQISKV